MLRRGAAPSAQDAFVLSLFSAAQSILSAVEECGFDETSLAKLNIVPCADAMGDGIGQGLEQIKNYY